MEYYNVQDLMEITKAGQNKCYEIIRELNKRFHREFPKAILIQGQVPKWYFDECMGFAKRDELEAQKKERIESSHNNSF